MSDATSNGSFKQITRHSDYYIPGGDLSILVEHTQFRIHRFFFERDSKWFQEQLLKPASPGTIPQGSSDTNSIILENLTPAQFARFLWVFYNPRYSIYETSYEDWESILQLSERWKFPEVKNLAIRELERIDITDVKRIKLYHENNVDRNLLMHRYAALCEREEPLTLSEGMDLGMETTLQIAAAREQARLSLLPTGARSPSTPITRGDDLRDIIRQLFHIDAAPVTTEESAQNSGALKPGPPTKQQVQETKPPLPPKKPTEKPTEKPTNQTQNPKKPKGKQAQATLPLPKTTTPTPTKETKPQPPAKENRANHNETKGAEKTDPIPPQKDEEPDPTTTTTTDSGSGTLLIPTGGGSSEENTDPSSQPPSDPDSVFNQNPPFEPFSFTFGQTTSNFDSSSIFGQNSSSATDPTQSVFGGNPISPWDT